MEFRVWQAKVSIHWFKNRRSIDLPVNTMSQYTKCMTLLNGLIPRWKRRKKRESSAQQPSKIIYITLEKRNIIYVQRAWIFLRDQILLNFAHDSCSRNLLPAQSVKKLGVWRIPFKLCKLLFMQHHCNVSEYNFFNSMRDQNIQRK